MADTAPSIEGTQKRTIILTTTHLESCSPSTTPALLHLTQSCQADLYLPQELRSLALSAPVQPSHHNLLTKQPQTECERGRKRLARPRKLREGSQHHVWCDFHKQLSGDGYMCMYNVYIYIYGNQEPAPHCRSYIVPTKRSPNLQHPPTHIAT